jgi:hypothetical protein
MWPRSALIHHHPRASSVCSEHRKKNPEQQQSSTATISARTRRKVRKKNAAWRIRDEPPAILGGFRRVGEIWSSAEGHLGSVKRGLRVAGVCCDVARVCRAPWNAVARGWCRSSAPVHTRGRVTSSLPRYSPTRSSNSAEGSPVKTNFPSHGPVITRPRLRLALNHIGNRKARRPVV